MAGISRIPDFIIAAIDKLLEPYGLSMALLERKTEMTTRRYMSVAETADYLRVARSTLRRWTESGEIPVIQLGGRVLFDMHDVDNFLLSRKARRTSLAGTHS